MRVHSSDRAAHHRTKEKIISLTKSRETDIMTTNTNHNVDVLVQVLARGKDCLGGGKLKVPHFILHPTIELLGMLLTLQMKFDRNRGILWKERTN